MGTLKPIRPMPARQSGFVMVLTLIILVIITLSSLAMMLATRAGVSAAGNIAFRQAATRVADVAVEDAMQWMITNAVGVNLNTNRTGYYATNDEVAAGCSSSATFLPQTYDFANAACATPRAAAVSGYQLYYVIHRMASPGGAGLACTDPLAGCMFSPVASSAGVSAGASHSAGQSYQTSISNTAGLVFYRITVKVIGPRHNNRYVQAFVY